MGARSRAGRRFGGSSAPDPFGPRGRRGLEEPRRRAAKTRVAVFPPLVARAQNGSLDAFRELVVLFQDRAFALALALEGDPGRARHAASTAFVRAHAAIGELTDVNQVPTFLRDHVRRACALEPGPAHEALALLLALPREQERTTTALARVARLDDARVAEFLDLPTATVHNRLEAARRRLKKRGWRELEEAFTHQLPSTSDDFANGVVERVGNRA